MARRPKISKATLQYAATVGFQTTPWHAVARNYFAATLNPIYYL
jgi:hypothetical protein